MELSSKVRYALLALLELAKYDEQGKYLQIEQIAAAQQIPERYLAQLLMALRRSGIVRSQRGAKGGYSLAGEPWQIKLLDVLTCLEGNTGHKENGRSAFPTIENDVLHEVWQEASTAAMEVLGRYTLQDLCHRRDERQQSHPMYYI